MIGLGLGLGLGLRSGGGAAFDPTALPAFRTQLLGGALQTDTAGHNNYTIVGSPTTGTQNGLTTSISDGSTVRWSLAAFSLGNAGASGVTIAMAVKTVSSDATFRQLLSLSDALTGFWFGTTSGKLTIHDTGAPASGTATISGLWKRIVVTNISGANGLKGFVNGVLDVQQLGVAVNDNEPSQISNFTAFAAAQFGEILAFNTDYSSDLTTLGKIDSYLATKWNI